MLDGEAVTRALDDLSAGRPEAMERLLPMVYDRLRALARRELARERPGHTLSATALVHEAYLRLVNLENVEWRGRAHFLGACAQVMRRVLVESARRRNRIKRGGGAHGVTLDDNLLVATRSQPAQVLALEEALQRLELLSPRQARVVECRYFAGMEVDETAEALGISPATVKRDWTMARAWLSRELAE
jgi:RNA polymerase sigma factor (TIGR02999 family)